MCLSKPKHCQTSFFLYRLNILAGKVAVTDIIRLDLREGAGDAVSKSDLISHKTDAQRAVCSRAVCSRV